MAACLHKTLTVDLCEPPVISFSSDGFLCQPQNTRGGGGGFALYFFGGGALRRLLNASHSSFCISASHFELKLDLARERESFMLVF
jgi:hypothetical protein